MTPTTPPALDAATPLAHALAYARLGWRVVPIPPGLKRPDLPAWQEQATTDPSLITDWFTRWPQHGIGLVCGAGSGVFALDVDPAHGGDETLADLEAQHGALPDTVEAITGGGGRHLLFAWPELPAGAELRNSAGRLGPGLDIRAEGGQIVVAPSVHPTSGRRYEWEASSLPGETAVATAPAWLVDLLTEDRTLPEGQTSTPGDPRFAWDAYEALGNAEAQRLLEAHGWHSPRTDREGVTYLVRPGKARGDGNGCAIGKVRQGLTFVFTSEAPPLEAEHGYRLPELYAALEHQGDRAAADAALCARSGLAPTFPTPRRVAELSAFYDYQRRLVALADANASHEDEGPGPHPIRWPEFWGREHVGEDWLVHPILPRGRQVALWARHKTGKSLLTLEVAAALAVGRGCLSQAAGEPIDVVYLDMEMTEDDLRERLEDLGYGPDDDLARLHYYLLPSLPALDTEAGGRALHAIADRHEAKAVVIDTMARVVAGDENDADTYRDFYRCTGMGLKARGISVLRLDHGGKDPTKGQRGSSSKGDDVDVVWQLRPLDSGLELKKDVSRMAWVPEKVVMQRTEGPLRHIVTEGAGYAAGTKEVAEAMLELGVDPLTMTQTAAVRAYRESGRTAENRVLRDAYKFLKAEATRELKERRPWETGPDA